MKPPLNGVRLVLLFCLGVFLGACAAPAAEAPKVPVAQPTTAPAPPVAPKAAAPTDAPKAVAPTSAPPAAAPTGVAKTAATAAPQAPAAAPAKYAEAPALAERVKAGSLPAVEQRLPKVPVVVKPLEKVGKYGGTWRAGLLGGADTLWLMRTIGYENLVRWDTEWKTLLPNIAESYQASADAKEYTFKLRDGIKWSDGKPFTVDDIMFWYEDVLSNKELTPNPGTNPPTVTKVDALTVKFTLKQPDGFFLYNLATSSGNYPTRYPKHYLQQFHSKYNTTNLDQLVKDNNAENWVKLFQLKGGLVAGTPYDAVWANQDLPTLHPWVLTTPYGGGARVVAERNPYFWKVDTAGNQLPYIDRVTFDVAQDVQVLVLKAANGEIDMQNRHINANSNKAVFVDNQQKGGFGFFETIPSQMNTMMIGLNMTHKDPMKRQIFANKDFRIGLSHAINRQEIIDIIYVGQGEPWQGAPQRETPFFNERLAKQYTEYNVAKANEYLDKVLPQKDGEGFRLGPDGKRFSFTVEVSSSGADWADSMNLVKSHWQKVGVDAQVKVEDRSLFYSRKDANEHDAAVWLGGGGLDALTDPRWFFPEKNESLFAQAWVTWYRNPSGAGALTAPEEPPAAVKQQIDLYKQIQQTGDLNKQIDLFKQILDIAADQFYGIGISSIANGYGIVKNNMKNVPKLMFATGGGWPEPAPTNTITYFFE